MRTVEAVSSARGPARGALTHTGLGVGGPRLVGRRQCGGGGHSAHAALTRETLLEGWLCVAADEGGGEDE